MTDPVGSDQDARRARQRVTRRRILTSAATLAGLALLAWQINDAGIDRIAEHLSNVGVAGFLAILAVSGCRLTLRALAWRSLIANPPPLRRALAATISGDAIGNLTPLSLLASEPIKAMYLGGRADAARAFAALAAENFFYSTSVALYVTLGTAAMLASFGNLPAGIRSAGFVILVGMSLVLLGAIWLAWQRPRVLTGLLARVPFRTAQQFAAKLHEFETNVYGSTGHADARLGRLLACETAFHFLSFTETWLTLWLLTGVSFPLQAFVLDTVNRVVNVVFRVVPLRVGVDEATAERVAQAIGLPDAIGVATALVRKARVIFWSLIGLTLLARKGLSRL